MEPRILKESSSELIKQTSSQANQIYTCKYIKLTPYILLERIVKKIVEGLTKEILM